MRIPDLPRTPFWPYDIFGYLLPGLIVLIALVGASQPDFPSRVVQNLTTTDVVLAILGAYIIGHLMAALSSRLVERELLARLCGYPTEIMLQLVAKQEHSRGKGRRLAAWIIRLVQPEYFRPYSAQFQVAFRTQFRTAFNMAAEDADAHDIFWLCWEYIALTHPICYRRATHFLELYGFTRNAAMSLAIVAATPWVPWWDDPMSTKGWMVLSLSFSILLFANYLKLIRRMNDEVYRGFVAASHMRHSLSLASKDG
jgi:hypothetical protein